METVMACVTAEGYDLSSSTWRMHPARTAAHIQRVALRARSRQTHHACDAVPEVAHFGNADLVV